MEYKIITRDRFDSVISHLRESFFSDEPLNKAAGLCVRGIGNTDLEHHSFETLAENLSIMAVNEEDEIAGVVLNGVLHPGDVERAKKNLEISDDENFKKIFTMLYNHHLSTNIFEKFNVDKIFDVRILSVGSKFRGQGIAKELIRRSESVAKDCSFKIMKADGTGIFSQKILKSNGFEVLSELYYNKYTDEFGNPILPVDAPHIKLQLLYKILD